MNKDKPLRSMLPEGSATDLMTLTILWVLAILLVNPSGDFPLNDDWSYGIAVKDLVETGSYQPTRWTSMTMISQVGWGALFCSIFGFSFEVLRFSTLLLSLLGIYSVYLLVRQQNQPRWLGLLGALLLAFNALYFSLSYTFMTDVPFVAFSLMSLLFLLRYFTSASTLDLMIGTLLAILAILCRQAGLFIPLAFCITLLCTRGFHKKNLLTAFAPLLASAAALLAFQYWMDSSGKTPELYDRQVLQLLKLAQEPDLWLKPFFLNTFVSLLYLGFFLSPLLLVLYVSSTAARQVVQYKKWLKRGILPLSILLSLGLIAMGKLMPIGRNVLHKGGVGLYGLWNEYLVKAHTTAVLPQSFWIVVTVISVAGGAALLIYLFVTASAVVQTFRYKAVDRATTHTVFFIAGALVYILPFLLLPTYFDRYLLIVVVLLVLVLLSLLKKPLAASPWQIAAGAIPLLLMAMFSIASTHDFLALNRTRWQVLEHLTEQKNVPGDQIHGGFEFNGLTLFDDPARETNEPGLWWSENINDYRYILSFKEVPGYSVISVHPYTRWLPPHQQHILLSRRDGGPISSAAEEENK